jgi:hypothetical protein
MNEEKQRIKIAEACGWRFNKISKFICGETYEVISPDLKKSYGWCETYRTKHSRSGMDVENFPYQTIEQVLIHASIPDYLNDLNAMHEAEKVLSDEQYMSFGKAHFEDFSYYGHCGRIAYRNTPEESGRVRYLSLTAAQRAEAFLKTLELWEE